MKITRSIFCGALAALAVVALMSGIAVMDQAHAVAGLGGASLAMAGLVTLKAPITVFYKGQYVAPGTEIDLPKADADRLELTHGKFGGPGEPDPASTFLRPADVASLKALNEHAGIHKGRGADTDKTPALARAELEKEIAGRRTALAKETDAAKKDALTAKIADLETQLAALPT